MRFYKCTGVYMRTTVLITVSRIVRIRRICAGAVYQPTLKSVSSVNTIRKAVLKSLRAANVPQDTYERIYETIGKADLN